MGLPGSSKLFDRFIEMDVPGQDPADVKARALAMCEKLLVNPVMEKASIEVL